MKQNNGSESVPVNFRDVVTDTEPHTLKDLVERARIEREFEIAGLVTIIAHEDGQETVYLGLPSTPHVVYPTILDPEISRGDYEFVMSRYKS